MAKSTMKVRRSAMLRESVAESTLGSGLRSFVYSKPGYVKKAALIVSAYGSLDTTFDLDGAGPKTTPEGIAHFLEHQLFKKQRGDLLMEYGRFGASANAFTYYNSTCFYFSTAAEFEPNLEVLLETIFSPWFSEEGVSKEKLIIEQELKMYLDAPERVIYRNLMESLYTKHPVRNDIGGTVESIQEIDAAMLERCWRRFYHPSNLIFVAAGDLDAKDVFARLERALPRKKYPPVAPIKRFYDDEPRGVGRATVEGEAVLSRPQTLLGYKDLVTGNDGCLERDLATTVALDLMFGRSTAWYTDRYERGLIDDSFSAGYTNEETFGFTMIGGESDEPEKLAEEVKAEIRRARGKSFSKADVERSKRKRIGRYLRSFNAPEEVAFMVMGYAQRGLDPFKVPEAIDAITPKMMNERIAECLTDDGVAVSILRPKKKSPAL